MNVIDHDFATRLGSALAKGPDALFGLLNELFTGLPGVRTVTWLKAFPAERLSRRIGTSDPEHFPVGAADPIDDAPWSQQIYGARLPVIGNTPEEMSVFIPETDDLVARGYASTLCMPIVIAGSTRGTLNLLGSANVFTPAFVAELATLLPIAALIFTFEEKAA